MSDRHWQQTLATDPPTRVYLEHPGDWRRTQFAIEQGDSRRTQVREPTPEDLGMAGTTRRDQTVCYSCRHPYPAEMIAGHNARGMPLCVRCEGRKPRVKR